MRSKATKVAHALRGVLSPSVLDELGREAGQSERLRVVTPSRLVMALIGALSGGSCETIADVLREFNRQQGTTTKYKAFYNRLARPSFPLFIRALLCRVLGSLMMRTLEPVAGGPLSAFTDIVVHDGSSFALKDALAAVFPGRFKQNGPAAVELHASFSGYHDEVFQVALAPDKGPERPFLPAPSMLKGKLLLADRGYGWTDYFHAVNQHGGHFIVRISKAFDPWVVAQWRAGRRHVFRRPRRLSEHVGERYRGRGCDFEVKFAPSDNALSRVVVLPGKEAGGTRLATNLPHEGFAASVVAQLYRFRWQVELVFKEWKSYANLRAFDTANADIAQGLIWASLLVAVLKRFFAHAAQAAFGVAISTRRAAMCLPCWLRELAQALQRPRACLCRLIHDLLGYLAHNARRAHRRRDVTHGRLAAGLREAFHALDPADAVLK